MSCLIDPLRGAHDAGLDLVLRAQYDLTDLPRAVCLVRVYTARPRDHAAAAADRRTRARAMLLLFETPAGYSLFKVKAEKKLQDAEVRATRGDDDATRRDATRARAKRRARSTRKAVGRATRARAAVDDAGRARREGSDGRGRGTTRGRTRGRARADGGRESIREGIGELGIGWRGRRDARTRD